MLPQFIPRIIYNEFYVGTGGEHWTFPTSHQNTFNYGDTIKAVYSSQVDKTTSFYLKVIAVNTTQTFFTKNFTVSVVSGQSSSFSTFELISSGLITEGNLPIGTYRLIYGEVGTENNPPKNLIFSVVNDGTGGSDEVPTSTPSGDLTTTLMWGVGLLAVATLLKKGSKKKRKARK
jgi:hypothetical protein